MASETQTMPSTTKYSPHRSAPPASDNGSSSLSDLDETAEEQQELDNKSGTDHESENDNDTEAETERIDPSPRKSRKLAAEAAERAMAQELAQQPAGDISSPISVPGDITEANGHPLPADANSAEDSEDRASENPRKRKRSSPLSELDEGHLRIGEPARKRSASARILGPTVSSVKIPGKEGSAIAEEDDMVMKDVSDVSEELEQTHEAATPRAEVLDAASVMGSLEHPQGEDINGTRSPDEAEEVLRSAERVEDELLPQPGAELDEIEAAVKTEEEGKSLYRHVVRGTMLT